MNTGILIVAHAPLASALRTAALHVYPEAAAGVLALDVSPKFNPEALANFKPKAYRASTLLPRPAIKTKTDWTLPNGGRAVLAKHNPLSTAETCTALQVH